MKPVLKKEDSIYFISSSEMIRFIVENSRMIHNDVCKFVMDKGICNDEYGPGLWEKEDLNPDYYNKEQIYWIGAFFEAHPWIKKMMIVFND